jgi:hypothetical protein
VGVAGASSCHGRGGGSGSSAKLLNRLSTVASLSLDIDRSIVIPAPLWRAAARLLGPCVALSEEAAASLLRLQRCFFLMGAFTPEDAATMLSCELAQQFQFPNHTLHREPSTVRAITSPRISLARPAPSNANAFLTVENVL